MVSEAGGKLSRMFPPESERSLSIVLFDEIEKAHPKLWNLLLGILEDGTVVLGNNEEVDFRQLDHHPDHQRGQPGHGGAPGPQRHRLRHRAPARRKLDRDIEEAAMREAKKVFPFEFLNRFDDIITYHTLKEKHLYAILDILIAQVHHRSLMCAEPFLLEITSEAKARLVDEGTDVQYGARPLKRVVEKEIVTPISHYICSDQIRKGDLITVDLDEGALVFRKETGVTSWEELESLGPFPGSRWAKEDLGVRDDGGEKKEIVEQIAQVVATAGALGGADE